jgi:NADH-quinone oxidoreductase subunit L
MFLGLGTGLLTGVSAAMFHLVTHAFFKALLFLGAGSVMHAMGGVIDMREFSGLRKKMPQTYWTFLVGALALSGFFPLSGFWSKDAILSAAHEASHASASVNVAEASADGDHEFWAVIAEPRLLGLTRPEFFNVLFWMGSFTALLTAFYTFRAFFMTFHGPEKIPHEAGHHAHESPPIMCIPLWILAAGAVLLGALLDHHTTGIFNGFLELTIPGIESEAAHHGINWFVMASSTAAALLGFGAAFGPLTDLSRNKFYFDEIYAALIVWPLRGLAHLSRFLDWGLIDGLLVGGIGKVPVLIGKLPRPIQNGLVQFYALAMSLALGVLMWVLLTKQS